jgi:hypothetical protein
MADDRRDCCDPAPQRSWINPSPTHLPEHTCGGTGFQPVQPPSEPPAGEQSPVPRRPGHDPRLIRLLLERDIPCPGCGYNLRGLESPTCPECGFGFDRESLLRALNRTPGWSLHDAERWLPWVLTVASLALTQVFRWNARVARWRSDPTAADYWGACWLAAWFTVLIASIALILRLYIDRIDPLKDGGAVWFQRTLAGIASMLVGALILAWLFG